MRIAPRPAVSFGAAAALALLVASCGGGSGLHPRLGVVQASNDNPLAARIEASIRDSAGSEVVTAAPPTGDAATLEARIDHLISKGAKALAVALPDPASAAAVIGLAKDKQVPVVFFALRPSNEDLVTWDKVFFVGSKAGESGTLQGEIAAAWWYAHPEADRNRDGRMQYVMLTGEPGLEGPIMRTAYSIRALGDAGIKTVKLAEEAAAGGRGLDSRVAAQERLATLLSRLGPRIEFVFCNNDEIALGAIDALKSAGYFKGGKSMPVVGIDADKAALDAIGAGELVGTVLEDADRQGRIVRDLASALAQGGELGGLDWPITDNKFVWVPCAKVTRENLASFLRKK